MNPKATHKITKWRVTANEFTQEIKWNHKQNSVNTKQVKNRKENKKQMRPKYRKRMADISNLAISTITLNANGLKTPIKNRACQVGQKARPKLYDMLTTINVSLKLPLNITM